MLFALGDALPRSKTRGNVLVMKKTNSGSVMEIRCLNKKDSETETCAVHIQSEYKL